MIDYKNSATCTYAGMKSILVTQHHCQDYWISKQHSVILVLSGCAITFAAATEYNCLTAVLLMYI